MDTPLHIVCGNCDAVNRLPQDKLRQHPVCGKCKQAIFASHPVMLTHQNFDVHIGRNDIPVLVDFWAPWCGPCLSMAPAFETAAQQLAPDIRVAKLNTEVEQSIAARYCHPQHPDLDDVQEWKGGRQASWRHGFVGNRQLGEAPSLSFRGGFYFRFPAGARLGYRSGDATADTLDLLPFGKTSDVAADHIAFEGEFSQHGLNSSQ